MSTGAGIKPLSENTGSETQQPHGLVEEVFETALFSCRFLVLISVLGILAASVVMFFKGCIEVVQGVRAFWGGFISFQPTPLDDKNVILSFIPAVDNYLFASAQLQENLKSAALRRRVSGVRFLTNLSVGNQLWQSADC